MLIIGLDYDGTCVTHSYPEVGQEIGAPYWIKKFIEHGAKIVLNTMRDGVQLDQAVDWCHKHGIKLYGVNKNPDQTSWTTSPKIYAHLYIDDAAYGCPLVHPDPGFGRPYVDWDVVGPDILRRYLYIDEIEEKIKEDKAK